MSGFAALSDEALMERIAVLLASCERIMAMPEEERRRSRNDGHIAAPQEFGHLQAVLCVQAWNVALERGLVTEPLV